MPFFVWCQTETGESRYGCPERVRGLEDDHVQKAIEILGSVDDMSPEAERRRQMDELSRKKRKGRE